MAGTPESQWRAAFARPVVRRALGYAVVVGSVLVAINHGDAILAGSLTAGSALKIALTVVVPYCVSTLSSVAALRDATGQAIPR